MPASPVVRTSTSDPAGRAADVGAYKPTGRRCDEGIGEPPAPSPRRGSVGRSAPTRRQTFASTILPLASTVQFKVASRTS